jgi:hypothetical protein
MINTKLRRLRRRFGDASFTVRDGQLVTKIAKFSVWVASNPRDDLYELQPWGTRYKVELVEEASPEPLDAAAPAQPPATLPPDVAKIVHLEVHDRRKGNELLRLRQKFGRGTFTTFGAETLLRIPNFESFAKDNPIQGDLQVVVFADRWQVVDLTSRLAQKVVPRLSQLKQPFSIPAASLMLNGMPITATNQILTRLVQGGAVKPGAKAGTFAVIPPKSEWWS